MRKRNDGVLRVWLRATGVVYALGALGFVVRPADAPRSLQKFGGSRMEHEPPGLYNALASAYMATIAALALAASEDDAPRGALIPPLLIAKAASSAALFNRFRETGARGFAAGAALDASILGVTAALYRSSR